MSQARFKQPVIAEFLTELRDRGLRQFYEHIDVVREGPWPGAELRAYQARVGPELRLDLEGSQLVTTGHQAWGPVLAHLLDQLMHMTEEADLLLRADKVARACSDALKGKPDNIKEKIVQGKVDKILKEMCLLYQPFIKDQSITIEELIKQSIAKLGENIQIRRFQRYVLGEGIEKKESNLAEEVAAQTAAAKKDKVEEPKAAEPKKAEPKKSAKKSSGKKKKKK